MADYVSVVYHSAFHGQGFSSEFCERYAEVSGGERPDSWAPTRIKIDNPVTMSVIDELGPDRCGRGLTVARLLRRHLPALRLFETDGCEYPELDAARFVVHWVTEHFKEHGELSKQEFASIQAESRQLHLRVVSRVPFPAGVSVRNRYECLSQ